MQKNPTWNNEDLKGVVAKTVDYYIWASKKKHPFVWTTIFES
jgi:hypothetical protein